MAGTLYLTLPPSADQFHLGYMGWRWIEGDLPYHDFIDMNWPGTIGLHAISNWIFGVHIWSWRAADFTLFAASAAFLADLVRQAHGREAGKYCLILSPLIYIGMNDWIAGQHDMSAAQFLVPALWFHVRAYGRRDWRWQLAAGAMAGAAMLCKPTVGVIVVLLPLQALWALVSLRTVFMHTLAFGVALVAIVIAAMAGVVALGTPLSDLVNAIYTYNAATQFLPDDLPAQAAATHARSTLGGLAARVWAATTQEQARWWLVTAMLSLPAVTAWLRPSHRSVASSALPVLVLTGVLSFVVQARGFGYHLSPCVPALIGGLTASLARAVGEVRLAASRHRRMLWLGYLAIASLWVAQRLVGNFYTLPQALVAGDFAVHLARFNAGDNLTASDVVAFARHVEATDESGCVLAVGTVNAVNYLSKRRQPTRFYYFPVITRVRAPMPMAERWFDLWESDLKQANCRYVLIAATIEHDWLPGSTRPAMALRTLLQDYRRTGVLGATGGMVVYERMHGR